MDKKKITGIAWTSDLNSDSGKFQACFSAWGLSRFRHGAVAAGPVGPNSEACHADTDQRTARDFADDMIRRFLWLFGHR